ncbi:hypothetical protein [Cellulomonas endometrii]|uniref:hypothetical protein n=1 Tax=Cellulomonas endometrii TaxID=3036301 RepID=UPI0024ADCDF3|nr:hypothetical protein [Cellulomonas endometrii]
MSAAEDNAMPEHRRQPVSGVILTPDQEKKMKETVPHPSWCDEDFCSVDNSGLETVVDHRSTPFRLEQPAGTVEVYVARTCTTWSETWGTRRVVLSVPGTTNIDELRGFNSWLRDALDEIERTTTAPPKISICPEWCTAEADGDERVRGDHTWRYFGWHGTGYVRTHWGPVGKTYRTQGEMTDASSGRSRWGRVIAGRRIARTAASA